MILADTSVWIDFLAGRQTGTAQRLAQAVVDREIIMGDLILVELLQGIRTESSRREAARKLSPIPCETLCGALIAPRAASNYRQLREQGITIRGTIDVIIATWCIENRVTLLHNDRDFTALGPILGLRCWPE